MPTLDNVINTSTNSAGLTSLAITHPLAGGEMFLHGAHVTRWKPAGHDNVLYVSPNSHFIPTKAIRGGVPICFPWFGPHPTNTTAPAHGFVRTRTWNLLSTDASDDEVTIHLQTTNDTPANPNWATAFTADYRVHFGAALSMSLSITNTSNAPTTFTEALHTYLHVHDVRNITVAGLQGVEYVSKVGENVRQKQHDAELKFATETDRVYVNHEDNVEVIDPGMNRKIIVSKRGSRSTIVWNPFAKRAVELSDIGADNWPGFVCVESGNALDNVVTLAPGATHELFVLIEVIKI